MDQARKLVNSTPTPCASRRSSPIPLHKTTGSSFMELLKDVTKQSGEGTSSDSSINKISLKEGAVQSKQVSCSTTPDLTLENAKSIQQVAEKQELPTKSASKPSCGVTAEARQTEMAPSANNISSTQTTASDDSANVDNQSHEDDKDKSVTPEGGQTGDPEKPQTDNATTVPPQQQKANDISEAKEKPSQFKVRITTPAPTTEDDFKPETRTSKSQLEESESHPQFEDMLRNSENSSNANVSMEPEMIGSSSREQLISATTDSPVPLRTADVKTIKRQQKGGWL
ncbi:hypothetical protein B7P43_G12724 [Cryptotermes secundus]|uniref:Uncharacterized protein n=3 Tax=Cryptotermes secundus TaxID=105785 RepID=A0A2J7PZ32_9NEOP|nr:hypothetical protein B7P43_G12724 [Cryptotermes secundus]